MITNLSNFDKRTAAHNSRRGIEIVRNGATLDLAQMK